MTKTVGNPSRGPLDRSAVDPLGADQESAGTVVWVLGIVCVFVALFAGVIGLRIWHEHEAQRRAALDVENRRAAFLSEAITSALAHPIGATEAAARGFDPNAPEAAADVLLGLGLIGAVRALDASGVERTALGAEATALRAPNLDTPPERALIVVADPATSPWSLAIAAPTPTGGWLIAGLDARRLVPPSRDGRLAALVDRDGRVIASADSEKAPIGSLASDGLGPEQTVFEDLLARGGAATYVRTASDAHMAVGAARVALARGDALAVVVTGPSRLHGDWGRTVWFYAFLACAPLLVAAGLCKVLLIQVRNLREARQMLSDSERRFRVAVEAARCGVWDWDIANNSVYLSDSLARMLGAPQGGLMTANEFLQLVGPEHRGDVRSGVRSAVGAGEIDVEFRAARLPVTLQARGRPWSGPNGRPTGRVIGVAIDVTEQKGAQARVLAAETRLRAALDSMSESFVLWDARRRLVLCNRKFSDFFNLEPGLLKPGASYEALEAAADAAIHDVGQGRDDDEAMELELTDGRWIHLSERPTQEGGLVSIGTDITALKRQETQLLENDKMLRRTVSDLQASQERIAELARKYEEEKIRAEEANRSKSEFLANMSHELRTPLNAVNGFSEIMVKELFGELGDKRYSEYARDILASGQHLLALINDILDMSKIEAGKMQLALEDAYPDELIEQCLRLMRGRAEEAGLELLVEMDDLAEIEVDPRAFKQVLLNLLSNAVKFTPEGGTVNIRAFTDAEYLNVRVVDTGIGIAEDDLARLGRPFEQIESQHSKVHQGSGLGLALSKSLVEMHGGTLTIDSTLSQGTTVTFTLPCKTSDAPALDPTPHRQTVAAQ
ncbi:MAG: ATP-binding protein [Maricaulaceae bacterium]